MARAHMRWRQRTRAAETKIGNSKKSKINRERTFKLTYAIRSGSSSASSAASPCKLFVSRFQHSRKGTDTSKERATLRTDALRSEHRRARAHTRHANARRWASCCRGDPPCIQFFASFCRGPWQPVNKTPSETFSEQEFPQETQGPSSSMHARHSDGLQLLCARALCSWPYTMNPKCFMPVCRKHARGTRKCKRVPRTFRRGPGHPAPRRPGPMIRAAPTLGIRFVFVSLLWMALVLGYASEFLYTSPASIPKILFHVGCTERSAWSAQVKCPGLST